MQQFFGIAQDGIVGPQTWSVLVTGSSRESLPAGLQGGAVSRRPRLVRLPLV
ncbi:MAG TPA: peptidoglycan-binding domain-containing protein [Trebonia sp.]|nr:peptidoglycan-binding domain-containing protein [Trebonia sp.]